MDEMMKCLALSLCDMVMIDNLGPHLIQILKGKFKKLAPKEHVCLRV